MDILIADDAPSIRMYLNKIVTKAGHNTFLAKDGWEAIDIVAHGNVDMVLMDIQMPQCGGIEATRKIRETHPEWIPIIFISATDEDEDYEEGLSAGGDGFLTKPINPALVLAQVRAMERIVEMRSSLSQLNQRLEELNRTDMLTGICNRSGFFEAANKELKLAQRKGQELSIMMIDIDHFKLYNDNYGHVQGDSCLRDVAQSIQNALQRPTDLACRYGGEEFACVLPDTDKEGARVAAEAICNAVQALQVPHAHSSASPFVSISLGFCSSLDVAADSPLEVLLNLADNALYEAKEGGRNRACFYEPEQSQSPEGTVS